MQHTNKVTVTRMEPRKRTVLSNTERLLRLIKIVLKLANVNGYDDEGRVRTKDGTIVSGSSVVVLLNHAMNYGQALIGENEFIQILKEAKVDPDLIVNENVRTKLLGGTPSPAPSQPVLTTYIEPENTPEEPVVDEPEPVEQRIEKRKFEDSNNEQPVNKRRRTLENSLESVGWEVPQKRRHEDD